MDDRWREAHEFWERLRWARHQAGFEKAKDAAISLNIKDGTYRTYERSKADDGRIPAIPEIQRIAKKFKVSWAWLAAGDGTPADPFVVDYRVSEVMDAAKGLPADKRDDAFNAAISVLRSYGRKA